MRSDLKVNELEQKRKDKFMKQNKEKIFNILDFINNKDEIKASQEVFKIDSLKSIRRMEQLVNEIYDSRILILESSPFEKNSRHLSVYVVDDENKLFETLNDHLVETLGEKYEVTHELLITPSCLSFNNGKEKLYLHNYDQGVIEV
jgi:SepF-like predicted cell division protein (DUF552 family)